MPTLLLPLLIACVVAPVAVAGEASSSPDRQVRLEELEAARVQVSLAQQMVLDARLRLSELRLEQRVQKRLSAHTNSTQPAIVANPAWQDLAAELARRESEANQLSERLQAAHPEMQKIESELAVLRTQLERIPQLVPSPQSRSNVDAFAAIDSELQAEIERAQAQLARAEENLTAAEQHDAQLRAAVAKWNEAKTPVVSAPEPAGRGVQADRLRPRSDHSIYGWICLLIALGIVAVSWRRQAARAAAPVSARRRPNHRIDKPVQRIVYRTEPRVRSADRLASSAIATDQEPRFSYSHSPRPAER